MYEIIRFLLRLECARAAKVLCCLLLLSLVMPVLGCSGGSGKKSKKSSASTGANEKLPRINHDTDLEVDEKRVVVAAPAGWTRSPRSKDYLVRYQPGGKKTYPSIVLTVSEPPAGFAEITAENHAQFAAAIAADLAETFTQNGKNTLLKQPTALPLGSHLGVSWSAPGMAKVGGLSDPIDRVLYAVVIGERMYTVEARAPKGKLDDAGRAAAKAVAMALAGANTDTPAAAKPVDTEPVDTEPVDTEPAKTEPTADPETATRQAAQP